MGTAVVTGDYIPNPRPVPLPGGLAGSRTVALGSVLTVRGEYFDLVPLGTPPKPIVTPCVENF